jgi:steroid delta-isomerase-like uncharacterized protein
MSQQDNIAATERLGAAVNSGNLDALHEVFAPNVTDRDPASDQAPGPEGFIQFFTGFRAAFPDLSISVEQLVADEDNVAIAYTVTGTHRGDFLGIPATGKSIKARGVQIARFENGQIVERWGSSDQLGILQQIGASHIPTA